VNCLVTRDMVNITTLCKSKRSHRVERRIKDGGAQARKRPEKQWGIVVSYCSFLGGAACRGPTLLDVHVVMYI
jgi:hypothetical protein